MEGNKEIIRLNARAINERNLELLEETTSADVVRHCQATPGIQVSSLEAFVDFLRADWETFPDGRISIQQLVAEGDRVAVFGNFTGTQMGKMGPFPASGRRMCLDFSGVFRIESERIVEIWVTWDNLAALTQLGHFPAPGNEPAD